MVVRPEYTAGRGRADFALCDDSGNPKIFIEVKGLGGVTEKAVEQVMQYAFRVGVPIVVLTDGRTWTFYLPAEGGSSYEAKRAFKLDVLEHSPQKSSEFLQRYLEESRVVSGEAFETARVIFLLEKYRKDEPDMWEKMVDEAIAKFMRALRFLAEEIGPKSAQDNIDTDIVDYFHSLLREKISPSPSGITAQRTQPEPKGQVSAPPKSQSPLQNPDTIFQVGSVSRKLQTGGIRQQVFNLINEGKEVTLGTIINTIPKDKAVPALRSLVKRKIVAIK